MNDRDFFMQATQEADEARQQFAAERRSIIGGTDASAILGKNPWKDRIAVWAEKLQMWPDEDIQNEAMLWGTLQEHLVALEYCRKTGYDVRRPAKLYDAHLGFKTSLRRHPQYPFIGGHLDRLVLNQNMGLECKTTNEYNFIDWGPEGSDEVPEQYLIQCQHYMAVYGYASFDLAVLIGGNKHRIYHIPRNDRLIAEMLEAECAMWEDHIKTGERPAPDGSEASVHSLRRLIPTATLDETGIARTADERINQVVGEWADLAWQAKEVEAKMTACKAEVMAFLGDASELYIEDVRVATWCNNKDSLALDAKAFQAAHPELYKQFLVTTPGPRVLRPNFKRYVRKEERNGVQQT